MAKIMAVQKKIIGSAAQSFTNLWRTRWRSSDLRCAGARRQVWRSWSTPSSTTWLGSQSWKSPKSLPKVILERRLFEILHIVFEYTQINMYHIYICIYIYTYTWILAYKWVYFLNNIHYIDMESPGCSSYGQVSYQKMGWWPSGKRPAGTESWLILATKIHQTHSNTKKTNPRISRKTKNKKQKNHYIVPNCCCVFLLFMFVFLDFI